MKMERSLGGRRITKYETALRIGIIAAEIRLELDENDEDCPSWADDLDAICAALERK
jgi:hypothetical protein